MKFCLGSFLIVVVVLTTWATGVAQDGVIVAKPTSRPPSARRARSTRKPRATARPNRQAAVVTAPAVVSPPKSTSTAAQAGALGIELFNKKEYAGAEASLRQALAVEPKNTLHNYYLGAALLWQLKYTEGEIYLRKAVELEPRNAVLRKDLANDLYFQQKYTEAEGELRTAVRLEPGIAAYQVQLGNLLYYRQKYSESEKSFLEAVRLEPDNAAYQKALTTVQAAMKTAPKSVSNDAALHNNSGNALFAQQKYVEAEKEFREAVRLEPTNLEYTNNIAKAMIRRQDLEAAAGSTSSHPGGTWAVFTIVNKTTGPMFYQLLVSGEWKEFAVLPGRQAIQIAAFENPLYIVFDSKYEVGSQLKQRQLAVTKVSGHAPTESDKRKSKVNTFALNGSGEIELTPTP